MTAPFLHLPPTDRLLSSRTGWTRAHWEVTADRMLDALVPYATPGFAQYRLPGRASWSGVVSDGLEGYARSFLMAAFRIAGAQGNVDPKLIERYTQGLTTGTDRGSAEAWPELTDCSQQMVEAASIAVGLHETRPWIWDKLDTRVQERVVDWLSGFVGGRTWDNNWRLFQVVSEQFLASVGAPYNRSDIESNLDRIEDWYVGDGWYTDGDGRNFDYYIGWAMHLYPLLWSRMVGPDDDGGRTEVYRQRLSRFLEDYPQFFGSDGAPVHQGRSLTYRFAALAPVWMGALADCTPLAPGLTRRLASGTLRHFVERGVPDERGLLTLGWYDTFLPSTQPYSGPASPYWASKGFLGLLLPADHPVWTERELPLPVEESDQYTALPAPGWLLHGTRHDGIVRLINHGSDHNPPAATDDAPQAGEEDPHYARLCYSTATAPESAPHAVARSVDGHLALLAPDGTPSRRRRIHPLRCEDRIASSWYAAELPGDERTYRIETTSVLHGPWEIRVHRVEAPEGAIVREGGHAVAHEERPRVSSGPGWAMARTADGLTSAVVALYGWDTEEDAETEGGAAVEDGSEAAQTARAEKAAGGLETRCGSGVARDVQSNAYGPHSAIPYLRADHHPGGRSIHVSLIALSRDTVHPRALRTAVVVRADADSVVLTFLDGTTVEV
ncbi:DUF2264 domain-containing protein [Streptomyces sp. NBC_01799]|uniref:DUF2264 domain-containing protein n=1 Tax=Streptomyces sp. NBC_01800 TaxID=2975945 RepID=UPI002DDA902A|nr:DUF2264 domain-containing protein [Streptomyces sp. NBC_01800]WSA71845.1 DUF2264 domain-containing protein [Streptomyces sp. NBC_01800]WSA80327.1 DUF2264 domain-containing protein [Streptomyces sp. NBC_01799]